MKTKHAVASRKRRKKLLESAKGYWGERSKKVRRASETVRRAGAYSYRDRRTKKREFRSLWIRRLNAAAKQRGLVYGEMIHLLKANNIIISRDILAKIAAEEPSVFDKIVEVIKK